MEKENKIRALLVDDEIDALNNLSFLIGKFCPSVEVVGTASHVEEAVKWVSLSRPQLVFLDIAMPGSDGFDFLEHFDDRSFEVVFVTSYNQYAIRAFKYSAIDYLLKPIDIDELVAAVERVSERIITKTSQAVPITIVREMLSSSKPTKIALPNNEGIHLTEIADILYMEADGSYTRIYCERHKSIMVSRNLKEYEELLQEHHFFRVHNSYLINLAHVETYTQVDGGTIVMNGGKAVPVSRRRKALFETVIKQQLF